MTGRRTRLAAVVGGVLALALPLAGCLGRAPDDPTERLRPAILRVPGVTGGSVELSSAATTPMISCRLTGAGTTQEALAATLDGVLRAVTAETRELREAAIVSCTVTNGALTVTATDLGLERPTYLKALRARYR